MSAKTNTLMDAQLVALESEELALYTTAPTQTTNGTEVTDTDYARAAISLGAPADGSTAGTREADTDAVIVFGSAGAATGYTIAAVGVVDAGTNNVLRWAAYNQVIAVGEIPRIPIAELTFVEA